MSSFFIEKKVHSLRFDPSELEIGAGEKVAIKRVGVGPLKFPVKAERLDCVSGLDKGWEPISVGEAQRLIEAG